MHLNDLFDVIFRWAHLIAGIMWVGNSMLFNWLDRNLEKVAGQGPLSQGKIFMVHSGAFYDVEKKLLGPGEMPKILHWFKWQNFATWATGISLFVIVYYLNGAGGLVDPSTHDVDRTVAVAMSISIIFVAWLIYDSLWKLVGDSNPRLAGIISIVLLFASIFGFSLFFSGKATYMQTGVVIGTLMTGNVWMCIVPSQHELVNATKEGRDQDPAFSIRAKQRSIHNNYLTFPLLFIMVSNHFGGATSHPLNWLILILVMIGGAGIRHFMNIRYLGNGRERAVAAWLFPAASAGAFAIASLMIVTRIDARSVDNIDEPVSFKRAQEIIATRCVPCHSTHPSDDVFTAPPAGLRLDSPRQIQVNAKAIRLRAVDQQNMPFNNKTGITRRERGELKKWIDDGARTD
ncbi:MAG: urate hydroxylase PuuD [Myxococcales bacterium]|nr:urate hydroxylase PuuD [Myxococcales bacterium]